MLIKADKTKPKDYYDTCMGLGINRNIVFSRFEKIQPVTNRDQLFYLNNHPHFDRGQQTVRLIGFCGNIYKAIGWINNGLPDMTVEQKMGSDETFRPVPWYTWTDRKWDIRMYTKYFDSPVEASFWNLFDELKTPYFDVYFDSYQKSLNKNKEPGWYIKTGFLLKSIGWQRMFNAASCFQELQMFMANMAMPNTYVPELSNDDKILNAGFHLKTSFRKAKEA